MRAHNQVPAHDQFTDSGAGQYDRRGVSALKLEKRMTWGRNWALALAGAIAILVATTAAAQTPTYTFTTIDVPGAAWTGAISVNDAGQIVGDWGDGSVGSNHSFLLSGGSFTSIDVPGAGSTFAFGINNAGQIVGSYGDSTGSHGFVYSGGSFTSIDVPGATATRASSINNAGQIIGNFWDGTGGRGFLYSDGNFTTIDGPRDHPSLSLAGINAARQIVGSFVIDIDSDGAFLLDTDGSFTPIDVPGAVSTDAYGINDSGEIVGWFDGQGFLDIGGSFTTINVPGAFSDGAFGINNAGQIVGGYTDSTGNHGFLATPTQSPGLAGSLGRSNTNQLNTLKGGAHVFTSPAKNGR